MKITYLKNDYRHDVVKLLKGNKNTGVELGVAEGNFSKKMMESGKFKLFYGIDSYQVFQHNDQEYLDTKKKLSVFNNYELIRKKFDEAIASFEDSSLDFIYVDGFAHEGNDGGQTLFHWFKKVKVGGICAGDDYDDNWPLVKKTVNELIAQSGFELFVTSKKDDEKYSQFPSWYFVKENNTKLNLPYDYVIIGKKKHEEEIFNRSFLGKFRQQNIKILIYNCLKIILPKMLFNIFLKIFKKITKN